MANVNIAIQFVLRQEDARMEGAVTTLRGDSGGATRFGLASASHPELVSMGYYDVTKVDREAALTIAERKYDTVYAVPLHLPEINDQAVATAALSFSVNAWVVKPVKFLQQASTSLMRPLEEDGHMGPITLAALNACDPDRLLNSFCAIVAHYYRTLAAQDPRDAGDLNGWLNRVKEWQSNAASLRSQAKSAAS